MSSTPTVKPSQPATPSKTNVGAIAGGVVGGILVLISVLAFAVFCLRRRRRQNKVAEPTLSTNPASQQHEMQAEKYVATPTTASYPSGFPSPNMHTPGYSPQNSPSPPSWSEHHTSSTYHQDSPPMPQHVWTGWNQQRGHDMGSQEMPIQHASQQPYYPPPQDPSQSPAKYAHTASVELPSIRSPANEASEMPELRSPVPKHGV